MKMSIIDKWRYRLHVWVRERGERKHNYRLVRLAYRIWHG